MSPEVNPRAGTRSTTRKREPEADNEQSIRREGNVQQRLLAVRSAMQVPRLKSRWASGSRHVDQICSAAQEPCDKAGLLLWTTEQIVVVEGVRYRRCYAWAENADQPGEVCPTPPIMYDARETTEPEKAIGPPQQSGKDSSYVEKQALTILLKLGDAMDADFAGEQSDVAYARSDEPAGPAARRELSRRLGALDEHGRTAYAERYGEVDELTKGQQTEAAQFLTELELAHRSSPVERPSSAGGVPDEKEDGAVPSPPQAAPSSQTVPADFPMAEAVEEAERPEAMREGLRWIGLAPDTWRRFIQEATNKSPDRLEALSERDYDKVRAAVVRRYEEQREALS